MAGALTYVKLQDEELAEFLEADLEPLLRPDIFTAYRGLSEDVRQGLEIGLEALIEFLDLERDTLVAATSEAAWARARQHAVVAKQAKMLMAGSAGNSWRDKCMADNAGWILEQEPAGTRIVLRAHNGHVKKDGPARGIPMMGYFLAQEHGDDHLAIGFGFHHGGLQAIVSPREKGDTAPALRPFEVGPPTVGAIGEVLGAAGVPLFLLDLRRHEEGPVSEWLSSSQPMRSIGAIYSHRTAANWYRPTILAEQFDALLFVTETTPARPNPLTRKVHGIEDPK